MISEDRIRAKLDRYRTRLKESEILAVDDRDQTKELILDSGIQLLQWVLGEQNERP